MAIDPLKAQVRKATRAAMVKLARYWKSEIRQRINIRVVPAPGGPIRSEPFEPPRRDVPGTGVDPGQLFRSVHFHVDAGYDFSSLRLYTTCPYARMLNEGTVYIDPRPWWPDLLEVRQKRALLKKMIANELASRGLDPYPGGLSD